MPFNPFRKHKYSSRGSPGHGYGIYSLISNRGFGYEALLQEYCTSIQDDCEDWCIAVRTYTTMHTHNYDIFDLLAWGCAG
jgi:hypothetical protein